MEQSERMEELPQGESFETVRDFVERIHQCHEMSIILWGKKLVQLERGGKSYFDLAEGELDESVNAEIFKIGPRRIPLNIYNNGERVFWFNLTDENIKEFRISFRAIKD